jgi:hypothetical protein
MTVLNNILDQDVANATKRALAKAAACLTDGEIALVAEALQGLPARSIEYWMSVVVPPEHLRYGVALAAIVPPQTGLADGAAGIFIAALKGVANRVPLGAKEDLNQATLYSNWEWWQRQASLLGAEGMAYLVSTSVGGQPHDVDDIDKSALPVGRDFPQRISQGKAGISRLNPGTAQGRDGSYDDDVADAIPD